MGWKRHNTQLPGTLNSALSIAFFTLRLRHNTAPTTTSTITKHIGQGNNFQRLGAGSLPLGFEPGKFSLTLFRFLLLAEGVLRLRSKLQFSLNQQNGFLAVGKSARGSLKLSVA